MRLNEEERNLMTVFDTCSRTAAMEYLHQAVDMMEDQEFMEILCRIQKKLKNMSDEEFSLIDFTPAEVMTDE